MTQISYVRSNSSATCKNVCLKTSLGLNRSSEFTNAQLALELLLTFKIIIFEGNSPIVLWITHKCLQESIYRPSKIVFHYDTFSSMDPKKRIYVASGKTPNKPAEKRARECRKTVRKPLDFSSENVPQTSTITEIGGLISPEIDKRSRSPRHKVPFSYFLVLFYSCLYGLTD